MSLENRPPQPFEKPFDAGHAGGATPGDPQEPTRPLDTWEINQLHMLRSQLPEMAYRPPEQIAYYKQTWIGSIERMVAEQTPPFPIPKLTYEDMENKGLDPNYFMARASRETADKLLNTERWLYQAATYSSQSGDLDSFSATMDITSGMGIAMKDLNLTVLLTSGVLEAELRRHWARVTEHEDILPQAGEDIYSPGEIRELFVSKGKEQALQSQATVALDGSGFTAIDIRVARLQAEVQGEMPPNGIPTIQSYQNPELVVAGAELAQRMYHTIHDAYNPIQITPPTDNT